MQRDKRKVESSLQKKGFVREPERKHVFFVYCTLEGKRTSVSTHTSHGSVKSLSVSLLGDMASQCQLDKQDFLDLVDCPMDREKYEKILRDNDVI